MGGRGRDLGGIMMLIGIRAAEWEHKDEQKKLLYNLNTDVGILGKELSNLKKEIK